MGCEALWHELIHIKASHDTQKINSSPTYLIFFLLLLLM